jgi:hypothetical protein
MHESALEFHEEAVLDDLLSDLPRRLRSYGVGSVVR